MSEHEQGIAETTPVETTPVEPTDSGAPPSEKAHVKEWLEQIAHAERFHKAAFKQMRESMDIVALGGDKKWVKSGKITVPIIARHINLAVAQLYAKNPKAVVSRKPRMLYTVWDGSMETLQLAASGAQNGDAAAIAEYQLLVEDITAAKQYNLMADRTAKTLEILWAHVMDEQKLGTKKQLKSLVRRAKTTGVGYVKMGFQREFEPSPELDRHIADTTDQIAHAEQLAREFNRGDIEEDSADLAALKATLKGLQQQVPIAREGLTFSYSKSTRIIIDPACDSLKTLSGAGWLAEELFLTDRQIEKVYGVKVESSRTAALKAFDYQADDNKGKGALRVYEIQDRVTGMFLTICEGHDGYLKAPDLPPVFLEKFFTIFPLVFNEVEHETELFPASDAWRARHVQYEYNRARQGLSEHRIAARPYYVSGYGVLETDEKARLQNRAAFELIELRALLDGQSVDKVFQRGPVANIDQNLYEVESQNTDMLRTVGAQEANLGGLSGATATESSIGESSRMSSVADNVDDLDELLTDLARAGGVVLLMEMSKEQVIEIVGPGAVWPDAPPNRLEMSKELMLEVKAGSSGRPNQAAELANIERGAPLLVQLPGISPKPLAYKYAQLLDLDPDELYQEGAISIVAQNQLAGAAPAPAGPVPAAQGGQGGAPSSPASAGIPGPQAGFTQPGGELTA